MSSLVPLLLPAKFFQEKQRLINWSGVSALRKIIKDKNNLSYAALIGSMGRHQLLVPDVSLLHRDKYCPSTVCLHLMEPN